MIEEQCSTCKYMRSTGSKFECRFKKPKVSNVYDRAYWPLVLSTDWCRKWEYDGKCAHIETEPFINGDYVINRCKRCGGRA